MGNPFYYVDGANANVPKSLNEKLCGIYPDALQFAAPDPSVKTTESELVRGMLHMLQGFACSPFYWDKHAASFCVKDNTHVLHLSRASLRRILDQFLYAATCLQRIELFVKKVEFTSARSPPTLRAFANSVALWLKRLRNVALEEEIKLAQSENKTVPSLLGLNNSLSCLCSGAEYLLQIVYQAVPSAYFESETLFPPAEMAVHILDCLYRKLDEICPVQGGEEESYHMVLMLFVGSLLPYIESLDSWLHDGTLDDPFEEMFLYANNKIAIDQPAFWEKGYLLRLCQLEKRGPGNFLIPNKFESPTDNKRETGDLGPALSFSSLTLKDQDGIGGVVCPFFLKDIAKLIVSAGKSLHLLQHASGSLTAFSKKGDESKFNENVVSGGPTVSFLHLLDVNGKRSKIGNQFIERLTLPEIFCVSLSGLVGSGSHVYRNFGHENWWSAKDQSHKSCYNKLNTGGKNGFTIPALEERERFWYKLLMGAVSPKNDTTVDLGFAIKNRSFCFKMEEVNETENVNHVHVIDSNVYKEDAKVTKSFWPENPAVNLSKDILFKNEAVWDKMNISRNVCLPAIDYKSLQEAFIGARTSISLMTELNDGTNHIFGFPYDEVEVLRQADEKRMLSTLFPFPTLLPCFQGDVGMSEHLPFQKNSTVASKVLDWLLTFEPKVLTLPGVIVHECLVAYIGKQVDYIGQQILLKLMNGWKLMDELIVVRAIYLLGSGDLLQYFLTVLFDKLDKGEQWDDEFELNTVLQESIRNSSDGMLLNAPDSLMISILTPDDSNDGKNQRNSVMTLKGFNSSFGIDVLDMLKFTYKVSWPLELIVNVDAIKKYNQVMCFLLKVKRAKYVLDKARRWMWKDVGTNQLNRKRHFLVEQKLLHFVDAFHQYVMERVIHNTWLDLCEDMSSARSLDEVMEVHEAYLLSIQRLCFVAPDKLWALIANRIKSILGLALKFYAVQQILCCENAAPAVKESCENDIVQIEKQFDECITFLLRILSFKLNVGQFPHLEDLVTRINYNYFYLSQSGGVLTSSASDATASRIGRTMPNKPVF